MTGEVDQREIGGFRAEGEVVEQLVHLLGGGVEREGDVEADARQGIGHGGGIMARVLERFDGLVGALAQHQRDPVGGRGGRAGNDAECQKGDESYRRTHVGILIANA